VLARKERDSAVGRQGEEVKGKKKKKKKKKKNKKKKKKKKEKRVRGKVVLRGRQKGKARS